MNVKTYIHKDLRISSNQEYCCNDLGRWLSLDSANLELEYQTNKPIIHVSMPIYNGVVYFNFKFCPFCGEALK